MDEHTDVAPAPPPGKEEQPLLTPAPLQAPAQRLRVGWVVGRTTTERFGRALQPLAIGLMDELVEILALCPEGADVQELPSPPVETVSCVRTHRWGLFPNTAALEALAGELRHRKVRLLHALDADAWPLASRLGDLAGLNCLVSSYHLDDWKTLGRLGDSVGNVLAASECVRQALLNRRVTDASRIERVHPGVYQVRKPTCFLDPRLCVSIVAGGPMDDFASFEAVVRCFAELRRGGRDAVFFLMGNGRAEKRLRAWRRCWACGRI